MRYCGTFHAKKGNFVFINFSLSYGKWIENVDGIPNIDNEIIPKVGRKLLQGESITFCSCGAWATPTGTEGDIFVKTLETNNYSIMKCHFDVPVFYYCSHEESDVGPEQNMIVNVTRATGSFHYEVDYELSHG